MSDKTKPRFLVISHTPHCLRDGRPAGWSATVRELSHLAPMFSELVHVAPLVRKDLGSSVSCYSADNVRLAPVGATGGDGLRKKLGILLTWPAYARTILRELRSADAVHVRCPCNIGLLAVLLLIVVRRPGKRWFKYAGNWKPKGREPWSYRTQRMLLRMRSHGAVVTVNGEWRDDPGHVRAFLNPSLTAADLEDGRLAAQAKALTEPIRLLFVGRLEEAKGVGRALEILAGVRAAGVLAQLDIVGDGEQRTRIERHALELGLDKVAQFHGWLSRGELAGLYRAVHFCLLPSCSEGWPKVLSEGMAYGVVPVASDVSSIPQYLGQFGCGVALRADDVGGFVREIVRYAAEPERWKQECLKGVAAAQQFSYGRHVARVADVLGLQADLGGPLPIDFVGKVRNT